MRTRQRGPGCPPAVFASKLPNGGQTSEGFRGWGRSGVRALRAARTGRKTKPKRTHFKTPFLFRLNDLRRKNGFVFAIFFIFRRLPAGSVRVDRSGCELKRGVHSGSSMQGASEIQAFLPRVTGGKGFEAFGLEIFWDIVTDWHCACPAGMLKS